MVSGSRSISVLLVDDFQQWRRVVRVILQRELQTPTISEAADGLVAVQKAQEVQPDLVVLDIGLPSLDGIGVARRIKNVSPTSKIVFLTENRSSDFAEAALQTGASGYVVKSSAVKELLPAVKQALAGGRFISPSLITHALLETNEQHTHSSYPETRPQRSGEVRCRHQANFCKNDAVLVDGLACFAETTLRNGDAVVLLATESHRTGVLKRLKLRGVDVAAAIDEKRYTSIDIVDSISMFRFAEHLTEEAARAGKEKNIRVGVG